MHFPESLEDTPFKLVANFQKSIIISLEKKISFLGKFSNWTEAKLVTQFELKLLNSYSRPILMDTFHHILYCSHEKSQLFKISKAKKAKRIF